MPRLGVLLVRAGAVSEESVHRALAVQGFTGGRIGTLLLERGSVSEDDVGKALSEQHGCEYIPWKILGSLPSGVVAALPAKFAIRHSALPVEVGEGFVRVVLRDPGNLRILDELFFVTGKKIVPAVAPEVRLYQALEKYYGERRTPRFAILAEKLSRPARSARGSAAMMPPPPAFFPEPPRREPSIPPPVEVWGEPAEPEDGAPSLIHDWKIPDSRPVGAWPTLESEAGSTYDTEPPETISWEEMSPPLWLPAEPEASAEEKPRPAVPPPPRPAEAQPSKPVMRR